jgi:2-methylisocitrate lyase-like PEP mutase family enzyme
MAKTLLQLVSQDGIVYAPGVWDGLSARLAEQSGFAALCSSGFAIAASLGLPDAEVFTATENLEAVRKIRESSSLPIIADIDTGYGNAVNAARTAAAFRRAGVQAVFMEDQVSPKRCPICVGEPVELTSLGEAVGKVRAVVDVMEGKVIVVARTDSVGEEALERAKAYADAGADMIMPVSKTFSSLDEWKQCHQITGKPLVASLTAWTWVEREFTEQAMRQVGVKIALLPTQVVLAASTAMRDVLRRLAGGETSSTVSSDYMEHAEFVDLIGFAELEARALEYLPPSI